eukprot:TRINITY_DN20256_c0_g1_i1.p1 TRINITY_DN20256_c0_g1~~TRINITY_DN20256_c0_g1_i1.p1  ORF type:complete len:688 (+),score=230.08 TRINITY_DN20256_c0_g1_i1:70-2133(+)
MHLDGYTFLQALGQGRNKTSSVMLMEDNRDRQKHVVKRVDLTMLEAEPRKKTKQECDLLIALRHPNIVKYRESVSTGKWHYTVMEYCEGGSLEEYVARRRKSGAGPFPEAQVLRWMAQVCAALQYCHDNNVLHRDLKTATCFLSSDCTDLLLGDFGIAKVLPNSLAVAQTIIGSPCNMSPEVIQGRAYNTASDLWSLGCLIYEVVALRKPFPAQSLHQLVQQVTVDKPPPPPAHCSAVMAKIIAGLLVKDPDRRTRLSDILSLPEVQAALLPRKPSLHHLREDDRHPDGGGAVARAPDLVPMDKWLQGHYEKLSSIQKYIDAFRRADEMHVRQQLARAKPKTPDISSARLGQNKRAAPPAGAEPPAYEPRERERERDHHAAPPKSRPARRRPETPNSPASPDYLKPKFAPRPAFEHEEREHPPPAPYRAEREHARQDKPKSAPAVGAGGGRERRRRGGERGPLSPERRQKAEPVLTQQQKEQLALEEKKRKILQEREEKKALAKAAEDKAREDRRNNAEQRRLAAEARRGHKGVPRPEALKKVRDDGRQDRIATPTSPPIDSPLTPDFLEFSRGSRGSDRALGASMKNGSFGRAREGYHRPPAGGAAKDDSRKAAKRPDDKGDRKARRGDPASPLGDDAREERREQRRQAQDNLRAKIMEDRRRAQHDKKSTAVDMSVEICIPQHMR